MTRPLEEKIRRDPRYAEQLAAIERESAARHSPDPEVKPAKYRNVKTMDSGGRLCDSRLEARMSDRLRLDMPAVLQQVSIPLSSRPRDRMILDFLVVEEFLPNGRFIGYFADAKGLTTKDWTQKQRRFEDAYGLKIIVIKK